MLISHALRFVGFGMLFLVPWLCCDGQTAEPSVWRLKRDVAERERQLIGAQRELSEARARVALAEGQQDLAIAELRAVVAGHEGEVQWIRDHASWFCDPRELMTEALWDLARARAWLAEVEGDTRTLVAERKKIVGFHEQQIERFRQLEQRFAAIPDEKAAIQEALDQARDQLATAEKMLEAEQAKTSGFLKSPPNQPR